MLFVVQKVSTVITKTKILSFLNMHLVFCVDKTKLQFISSLILFFSSLFLTASQSICVQRERKRKHDEIKKGRVCMRARTCARNACGSRGEGGSCSSPPPVCVQQGCITPSPFLTWPGRVWSHLGVRAARWLKRSGIIPWIDLAGV